MGKLVLDLAFEEEVSDPTIRVFGDPGGDSCVFEFLLFAHGVFL